MMGGSPSPWADLLPSFVASLGGAAVAVAGGFLAGMFIQRHADRGEARRREKASADALEELISWLDDLRPVLDRIDEEVSGRAVTVTPLIDESVWTHLAPYIERSYLGPSGRRQFSGFAQRLSALQYTMRVLADRALDVEDGLRRKDESATRGLMASARGLSRSLSTETITLADVARRALASARKRGNSTGH